MTPPGRLQAMTQRLQATSDAVEHREAGAGSVLQFAERRAEGALQRDRPAAWPSRSGRSATAEANNAQTAQANCSSEKAGLSNIAIDRIEELGAADRRRRRPPLDRLDEAMQKAVEILREACPNTIPMTPVGRLEVMKQRLDAMIQAANAVRPALEDFYAALSDEQKAKFNRLGRADRAIGRLTVDKTGERGGFGRPFLFAAQFSSKFSKISRGCGFSCIEACPQPMLRSDDCLAAG